MADWPLANGDGQIATSLGQAAGAYGVRITANASANTKATSWTTLLDPLPFDVSGFYLQITEALGAAGVGYAIDIGVGAASSEQVIFPNLFYTASRANQAGLGMWVPLRIGKGNRVSARCQASTGSSQIDINMIFVSSGFSADPGFSRVTTYGVDVSGTTSASSIDPGATINTEGGWFTLVNATSVNRIKSFLMSFYLNNSAAATYFWKVDIGIGATPQVIMSDLILHSNTTTDEVQQQWHGPFPISIPAGVALKVRAMCTGNDATDRLLQRVSIYGLD